MTRKPGAYATFQDDDDDGPQRGVRARAFRHPHARASIFSRALLGWVTPLMSLGNQKQLDEHDVWPLQRHHQAAVVTPKFKEDFERSRSIPRAFLKSFGWRFMFTGLGFFFSTATTLVGPVVLNHVVSELSEGQYDVQDLTTWIAGLLATQLVQALTDNYANFDSEVIAIQFTAALKNLVYSKALRLDAEARRERSTGDITNMYTTDCDMILMAAYYVHQLWIVPLQIIAVSVLLYLLLGPASLAGFAVIALVFLINNYLSSTIFNLYMEFMLKKDDRLKVVAEAFKSITIVKFNAWEDKFLERIGQARAEEVRTIWNFMKFNAASVVLTWGMPVFISVASFSVYTGVMHKELTPAIVFTSIALFQLVQIPLRYITDIIASVIKARVAQHRISDFLSLPEIDKDNIHTINSPEADQYIASNVIVAVEDAAFGWEHDDPLLKNVNLHIKVGDLVVVHGPVGCGKSSLCSALIGDMIKTRGQVYVGGSVAYCAQQPWIQHATVRENILFGRPYDHKKYTKVLEACALTRDLESLPAGDRTEIGERGVNLSGGQKARVALARACYSDASIYILDSPLSAVDAIVQNEIFNKCLVGLLRNRTVILVTHNPEIIASDQVTRSITVDEEGRIVETRKTQGKRPFVEPMLTPLASHAYVKKSYDDIVLSGEQVVEQKPNELVDVLDLTDKSLGLKSPFRHRTVSVTYEDDIKSSRNEHEGDGETHRLIEDEERRQGRVGLHVFYAYYRAVGGFPVIFVVLVSQALWQGLQIASDFWLSHWSTDASKKDGERFVSESYRIQVYTLLGLTSAFMVIVRTLTVSFFGLRAAKRMFERMTYALMHAPMKFFDANPIGRILMRYSNDVTDVDIPVPLSFGGFFANLFAVGCTMATTAVIIQWKGVFLLPVVFLYAYVGHFYLHPAREVERVLRTTEAPILSHLSESIEGGSTIRAFGSEQIARFHAKNDSKLDTANKVWYARLAISRWFGLRIQLLGSLLVFIVAYSLVLLHNQLSAAIVGLAFSYVLKVSNGMERIIQAWSSVETTMVSPERLQQYTDVEQEPPHKIPSVDPPSSSNWPANGAITFQHVDFRYKDTDKLVLRNINFSITGGEKIGIVGRTGAGKSSLTMALFRINELSAGAVLVDGIDVGKIGLKALRQSMSIIPQNPVLFKGPLRAYLDPFDEYDDEQLWHCIRRVGLIDRVSSEPDKLEYIVEENGDNFSVGERQMLCMARALLRESRIVIFDEATAAMDRDTDQKLQRVIREAFAASTVLTIAHRLDTILDADRILVLDAGQVVEFATPAELVKKGQGHFFDLMREGGYLEKFTQMNQVVATSTSLIEN